MSRPFFLFREEVLRQYQEEENLECHFSWSWFYISGLLASCCIILIALIILWMNYV